MSKITLELLGTPSIPDDQILIKPERQNEHRFSESGGPATSTWTFLLTNMANVANIVQGLIVLIKGLHGCIVYFQSERFMVSRLNDEEIVRLAEKLQHVVD